MKYLPPFELLRRTVEVSTIKGELRISVSYDDFIKLVRLLIADTPVDEAWYLSQNEDVASAIQDGKIASAKQHFIDDGYFEGRLPFPLVVDEAWYLAEYPDVAENISRGLVLSASQHFHDDGYYEGRLPSHP